MSQITCMIYGCSILSATPNEYLLHLKDYHNVPAVYQYRCTISNCPQVFSKVYPFKKHINHHAGYQNLDHRNAEHTTSAISQQSQSSPRASQEHPSLSLDAAGSSSHNSGCSSSKIRRIGSIDNQDSYVNENPIRVLDLMALKLTLFMHKHSNFTRKDVYQMQNEIAIMFSEVADNFEKFKPYITDPENKFNYQTQIDKLKTIFDLVNTEHKFFKYLKNTVGFELPTIVTLEKNNNIAFKFLNIENDTEVDLQNNYLIIMPIEFQIKVFFECNGILNATLRNTKKLEKSSEIKNYINGSTWKVIKQKYTNKYVLPVWLYADEFEINDSQSSHSNRHSVCGIYYKFPTIPKEYQSRLCNIFVAGMVKKSDIKEVGMNKLMQTLVERFKKFEEEGINIQYEGETVSVRFVLCLIQGDNLGVHSMLLLASGFNATFYCRFCRRPKDLLKADCQEHADCLRRREDYALDLEMRLPSETGIHGKTVFNELPSFHVMENVSVDAMHDLFSSGVCKSGLVEILDYCIYTKKYFTVNDFNLHRKSLGKTCIDSELSRMPDIVETYSGKEKRKTVNMRLTSSETRILIHYITLIIGKLVPRDDFVWKYCITLVKLTEFCLRSSFSFNTIDELRRLINDHHSMYIELFKRELKPKHHFLVHYPSVISASGPAADMMCFRYEAKHRAFKQYAHIMPSRKNVCYSLCIKATLQFTYDIYNQCFFEGLVTGNFKMFDLRLRNYFCKLIQPLNIDSDLNVLLSSSVEYKGTDYNTGYFITLLENHKMYLFEIIEIMKHTHGLYLIMQHWEVGEYYEHLLAYEVVRCLPVVEVLKIDLFDSFPVSVHKIGDKSYFRVKNSLND